MSKPSVFIATPSFEGRPVREYFISLSTTQSMLIANGINYMASVLPGDPYLAKVRNRLAAQFLTDHPTMTDFFFLDDDIGWPAEKFLEFLHRPEDILCGIYPKKQDAQEFPVSLMMKDGNLIKRDHLYKADLVPTGFMRIKRHVLEKLAARSMKYLDTLPGGASRMYWEIFQARLIDPKMEDLRSADLDALTREEAIASLKRSLGVTVPHEIATWWGEDYFFVRRWQEIGGEVWVDPDIKFTHRGSKAWEANFGDSVRATLARGIGTVQG